MSYTIRQVEKRINTNEGDQGEVIRAAHNALEIPTEELTLAPMYKPKAAKMSKSNAPRPPEKTSHQRRTERRNTQQSHMDTIAAGMYGGFPMFKDSVKGVVLDGLLAYFIIGAIIASPAIALVSWWTVGGLALITKVSPFIGALLKRVLSSTFNGIVWNPIKSLFESKKDRPFTSPSGFIWNVMDGAEEAGRLVNTFVDAAIRRIPFGFGDRILNLRDRIDAILGGKKKTTPVAEATKAV